MPAKRCPMCNRVNPQAAIRCDCGYPFGADVPARCGMLRQQQRIGMRRILLGAPLVAVGVLGALLAHEMFLGVASFGLWRIASGADRVFRARSVLRRLDGGVALPAARIVR